MGDAAVLVLNGVDFALREGEFVAIEGRSGSGKSTFLHILGGLDGTDHGKLEYDGREYAQDKSSGRRFTLIPLWAQKWELWVVLFVGWFICLGIAVSLRLLSYGMLVPLICGVVGWVFWTGGVGLYYILRSYSRERPVCDLRNTQFGFVFQFYHLLPEFNVLENTLLGPMVKWSWFGYRRQRSELVERATKLLTDFGLAHRLHHKPNQLSGGERQRVAIARALMNNPRILFADEPTGNLDYETGRQIMGVLEKLHRENGQTIVMVTHDRALARQADRVLVLINGKLERPGEEKSGADKGATLDYSKE